MAVLNSGHYINIGSGPNSGNGESVRSSYNKTNVALELLDLNKADLDSPTFTTLVQGPNFIVGSGTGNFITFTDLQYYLEDGDGDTTGPAIHYPVFSGTITAPNQVTGSPDGNSVLITEVDFATLVEPYAPLAAPELTGAATLDGSPIINRVSLDSDLDTKADKDGAVFTGDQPLWSGFHLMTYEDVRNVMANSDPGIPNATKHVIDNAFLTRPAYIEDTDLSTHLIADQDWVANAAHTFTNEIRFEGGAIKFDYSGTNLDEIATVNDVYYELSRNDRGSAITINSALLNGDPVANNQRTGAPVGASPVITEDDLEDWVNSNIDILGTLAAPGPDPKEIVNAQLQSSDAEDLNNPGTYSPIVSDNFLVSKLNVYGLDLAGSSFVTDLDSALLTHAYPLTLNNTKFTGDRPAEVFVDFVPDAANTYDLGTENSYYKSGNFNAVVCSHLNSNDAIDPNRIRVSGNILPESLQSFEIGALNDSWERVFSKRVVGGGSTSGVNPSVPALEIEGNLVPTLTPVNSNPEKKLGAPNNRWSGVYGDIVDGYATKTNAVEVSTNSTIELRNSIEPQQNVDVNFGSAVNRFHNGYFDNIDAGNFTIQGIPMGDLVTESELSTTLDDYATKQWVTTNDHDFTGSLTALDQLGSRRDIATVHDIYIELYKQTRGSNVEIFDANLSGDPQAKNKDNPGSSRIVTQDDLQKFAEQDLDILATIAAEDPSPKFFANPHITGDVFNTETSLKPTVPDTIDLGSSFNYFRNIWGNWCLLYTGLRIHEGSDEQYGTDLNIIHNIRNEHGGSESAARTKFQIRYTDQEALDNLTDFHSTFEFDAWDDVNDVRLPVKLCPMHNDSWIGDPDVGGYSWEWGSFHKLKIWDHIEVDGTYLNCFNSANTNSGSITANDTHESIGFNGLTNISTSANGNTVHIDYNGRQWDRIVADSGATTASSHSETLRVAGNGDISTSMSGNILTISSSSSGINLSSGTHQFYVRGITFEGKWLRIGNNVLYQGRGPAFRENGGGVWNNFLPIPSSKSEVIEGTGYAQDNLHNGDDRGFVMGFELTSGSRDILLMGDFGGFNSTVSYDMCHFCFIYEV